jgi:transposase-like protein
MIGAMFSVRRHGVRSLRKRTEAEWRKIVATWRESGMTVSRFCKDHGISKSRFHTWKKYFAFDSESKEKSIKASGEGKMLSTTFLPVQVRELLASDMNSKAVAAQRIEIFLGNGAVVRISGELSDDNLSRIMRLAADTAC